MKPMNNDLFVIPDGEDFLLYAPLSRALGKTNGAGANTVNKHLTAEPLTATEQRYIEELYEAGLLNTEPDKTPVFPSNSTFMPHEVTLFLTSRCNLSCRYCYAEAGKKEVEMPFSTAKSAIDLIADNAGLLGLPKFAVGFHGGGEPTLAWDLMVKIVDYAHSVADEKGLDVEIFAATNGLLSKTQREYIVEKFTNVNISFDGPAEIQNYNRPTVNGGESFNIIYDNMKYFDSCNFSYGIRSTVTEKTIDSMAEVVEWMQSEFNLEFLHMEPVWQCGRCKTTGEQPPSNDAFMAQFLKAQEKAEKLGLNLVYSGLRLDSLLSRFCAAPGDGFNVLPEGNVTSCYEITESSDRKAELFHYGRFETDSQTFVFEQEKIERLRKYSVENIDHCGDCFCKWHCAGDCISKAFDISGSFEHQGTSRCELNRNLTLSKLKEML